LQIQLRQGGSLNPETAAMLGCACGHPGCWSSFSSAHLNTIVSGHPGAGRDPVVFCKDEEIRDTTPNPVWRSRASQGKPEQARALSERNRAQRDRELRERRFFREAQDIRT
jgi:hypothetical protein